MAHRVPGPSGTRFDGTPGQSEPASYSASLIEGERAPLLAPDDPERGTAVQYRYGSRDDSERDGLGERTTRGTRVDWVSC